MSAAFLGEIRMFAGNFPPLNWALCNGALVPIRQYPALFSLLGTSFGGNGTATFALPNLVDKVPLGTGQGPGMTNRVLGATGGETSVTLSSPQMATHTHSPSAFTGTGQTTASPKGAMWAGNTTRNDEYGTAVPDIAMAPLAMGPVGSGQPHENRAPYMAVTYIICMNGIFPQHP